MEGRSAVMLSANVKTKRWTREQYYQMADLGWFRARRVELIDGEIVEMSPQKSRHAMSLLLAERVLRTAFGNGFTVRTQLPLALDDENEPEPDLAVVKGNPRDFIEHPATAVLVVEVADSTREYDLAGKAGLYAQFGMKDYWVIDLARRAVVIHRQPVEDEAAPMGHRYASISSHAAADLVVPLAAEGAAIRVIDVLP
jgi:Uma2 family endonuclease